MNNGLRPSSGTRGTLTPQSTSRHMHNAVSSQGRIRQLSLGSRINVVGAAGAAGAPDCAWNDGVILLLFPQILLSPNEVVKVSSSRLGDCWQCVHRAISRDSSRTSRVTPRAAAGRVGALDPCCGSIRDCHAETRVHQISPESPQEIIWLHARLGK